MHKPFGLSSWMILTSSASVSDDHFECFQLWQSLQLFPLMTSTSLVSINDKPHLCFHESSLISHWSLSCTPRKAQPGFSWSLVTLRAVHVVFTDSEPPLHFAQVSTSSACFWQVRLALCPSLRTSKQIVIAWLELFTIRSPCRDSSFKTFLFTFLMFGVSKNKSLILSFVLNRTCQCACRSTP